MFSSFIQSAITPDANNVPVEPTDDEDNTRKYGKNISQWLFWTLLWVALLLVYGIIIGIFMVHRMQATKRYNSITSDAQPCSKAQSRLTFVATSPEEEERNFTQSGFKDVVSGRMVWYHSLFLIVFGSNRNHAFSL